jgi:hypothetical protein
MKQIILLNTGVSASKQTLAQFIALAGRAWITNEIRENSVQSIACDYERLPIYKTIPAWANKGVERKKPICYRHNDLYNIAERVREQGGAYFYIKKIEEQGYGTRYIEVPKEVVSYCRKIQFYLNEELFNQYADRHLAPTIYKAQGHFQMKEIMSERVFPDLLYEEDWIDFWYDGERIAVGFRPLADEVADEITKGLELL